MSVRVDSVGLGWWGKEPAKAGRSTGELKIVICFARTPEKRDEFASGVACRTAASLDEVLTDPRSGGAVGGDLPQQPWGDDRGGLGREHVFVGKPLTLSVEDTRAAVEAADEGKVILQVGRQRRRLAAHRVMRRLIDEGRIGDIQRLAANHSLPNASRCRRSSGAGIPPRARSAR